MRRIDSFRRRSLQLAALIALPLAAPFPPLALLAGLPVSTAALLTSVVLGESRLGNHTSRHATVLLWSEVVLASFAAAATSFFPLLFWVPLSCARMVSLSHPEEGWKRSVGMFLPAIVPLVPGIGFPFPGFSLFMAASCAASGTALFIYLMLREQEMARREIESRLKAKEAILSTLAHEIRTPLTVIQSTVDIIADGRVGPLHERQAEFLASVGSNVQRLVSLSDTILASLKVESAWFSLQLHSVDIRRVIKNVALQMRPVLEEKKLTLRYSFPKLLSRPPADESWIHQVLVNLVHNAAKHMRSGGTVIISVNENEHAVVVSVSDNGSGIRTLERSKVFNEYFQGDSDPQIQLEGAGLGLAIVKRVIEKHNGKVYVGSIEGTGTTFAFTLPLQEETNSNE